MAAAYAEGGTDTLSTPLRLEEPLSIEDRQLIIINPQHIAPMPLHLTLGTTVYLSRLCIEAVYILARNGIRGQVRRKPLQQPAAVCWCVANPLLHWRA